MRVASLQALQRHCRFIEASAKHETLLVKGTVDMQPRGVLQPEIGVAATSVVLVSR
jgi:hypothetical protein